MYLFDVQVYTRYSCACVVDAHQNAAECENRAWSDPQTPLERGQGAVYVEVAEIGWREYVRTCGNKFRMQLFREQGPVQLSEKKLEHAANCTR